MPTAAQIKRNTKQLLTRIDSSCHLQSVVSQARQGSGMTIVVNVNGGAPGTLGVLLYGKDTEKWPPWAKAQHGLGDATIPPEVKPNDETKPDDRQ